MRLKRKPFSFFRRPFPKSQQLHNLYTGSINARFFAAELDFNPILIIESFSELKAPVWVLWKKFQLDKMRKTELTQIEVHAAVTGWVAPPTPDDRDYFAYLQTIFKRYNISPSHAPRLEYNFVTRMVESEFYLQKVQV